MFITVTQSEVNAPKWQLLWANFLESGYKTISSLPSGWEQYLHIVSSSTVNESFFDCANLLSKSSIIFCSIEDRNLLEAMRLYEWTIDRLRKSVTSEHFISWGKSRSTSPGSMLLSSRVRMVEIRFLTSSFVLNYVNIDKGEYFPFFWVYFQVKMLVRIEDQVKMLVRIEEQNNLRICKIKKIETYFSIFV